jgi:YkoY family integral membrane protein
MLLSVLGQTFELHDIMIVLLLVVLEGTLSVDNALVLGLLARRLPPEQRKKALTYGLIGAFLFRFIAIATATILLKWTIFKLLGGAYLVYVAIKHFFFTAKDEHDTPVRIGPDGQPIVDDAAHTGTLTPEEREEEIRKRSPLHSTDKTLGYDAGYAPALKKYAAFWPTVFVIEMTDIAFAVDSIVAAIGVVGRPPADHAADAMHPKMWVIILGGFLGVVLMRFAAVMFIKLLEKFPRLELSGYLLVLVIGAKLCVDWAGNKFFASAGNEHPVDFHSPSSPAFWVFWVLMIVCFAIGFWRKRGTHGFEVATAGEHSSPSK